MLEINPGLILWTIMTFVIVLVILRLTAWKPLLAALTAREEKIRNSLLQAEEAQKQAQRLLDENKRSSRSPKNSRSGSSKTGATWPSG